MLRRCNLLLKRNAVQAYPKPLGSIVPADASAHKNRKREGVIPVNGSSAKGLGVSFNFYLGLEIPQRTGVFPVRDGAAGADGVNDKINSNALYAGISPEMKFPAEPGHAGFSGGNGQA